MGILNKLKERNERKAREKEINRYAEEARLEKLEKQERAELEQVKRLSSKRSEINKIREEKRKLNPSVTDRLFNPVSSRPNKREKAYPSLYGSSKRQLGSAFSTVSSPSFHQGFTDVLGSSINSGYSRSNQFKKGNPIYIKKGKKFIKVKGKKHRHKHSGRGSRGYDPLWGNSFGL